MIRLVPKGKTRERAHMLGSRARDKVFYDMAH